MALFLSPGVFPREIDLSVLPAGTGGVVAGFIGTANKGPMNTPTFVSSAQQYIDTFGEPFSDSYLGYSVIAYLAEGNSAWVMRVGVECEEGQEDDLADICIDTSGSKESGWGRIPVFKGIDFGKICTREVSSDNPVEIHTDKVFDIDYTDIDVSASDGATDATLSFTGSELDDTYTGAIDDSYLVIITSGPTSGLLAGAGFEVVRNSDGETTNSGFLTESTPGESQAIPVGTGDDDVGLIFRIEVLNSSPLEEDDSFLFKVRPDNTTFSFAVDGEESPVSKSLSPATFTSASDFSDAINTVLGAGTDVDYTTSVVDDTVCFRTETEGERIQIVTTEAFALEIGVQLFAWDIPRSHIIGTETGSYSITTGNNRVVINVVGATESVEAEATIPTGVHTAESIAVHVDAAGVVDGETYFNASALEVSDGEFVLLVETTAEHQFDTIKLKATFSSVKTLRFADELGILFPYSNNVTSFSDTRVTLPDPGEVTPASPRSCELDPLSSDCEADSAYFENIVGWFVAPSAGTWINGYTITLDNFNNLADRFTIFVDDANGVRVDRVDDVSFDPRSDQYIGNHLNPGGSLVGINGNPFINWEERPSYLGSDPDDTSTFELRVPSALSETFSGGQNGIPSAEFSSEIDAAIIGNPALLTGMQAFQNPEAIDIDLLLIPGNSSGAVIGQALQLCESRGDCLFLVDPPFGLRTQQVVDWHNGILLSDLTSAINSSYGALYHSWVQIFDQFNVENLFIPPSGPVAAVFAKTAREAESWFPPAGLRRGTIPTALDTEFQASQGERDLMYGSGNAVNPIVKFPQEGIVVFGQRTLQREASALDRVNVRMLLIFLKKNLIALLRNFLFEPNDRQTRSAVESTIRPFMEDILARRGVTAFKVVVDETNNTPERIDRNELHVTVLLKPTRAIEFIQLNLVTLRTDASFSAEETLAASGVVFTT